MKKTLLVAIGFPLLALLGCSRPQPESSNSPLHSSTASRTESSDTGEAAGPDLKFPQVWKRVQRIVSEQLKVDRSRITPSSTFQQLGADSLDTVELVITFEEEFAIEIPDEKAAAMRTVGDCVTYFAEHATK